MDTHPWHDARVEAALERARLEPDRPPAPRQRDDQDQRNGAAGDRGPRPAPGARRASDDAPSSLTAEQAWQTRAMQLDQAARMIYLMRLLTADAVPAPQPPLRPTLGEAPSQGAWAPALGKEGAQLTGLIQKLSGVSRLLGLFSPGASPLAAVKGAAPEPPPAAPEATPADGKGPAEATPGQGAGDLLAQAQKILASLSPDQSVKLKGIAKDLFGTPASPGGE